MIETLDAVLWCAALATWLMMFSALVRDAARKILTGLRGKPGRQRG